MGGVIALMGFMGSGKSAVGRALAQELEWDFLDLDDLIEERAGTPIAQIFSDQGESGFRRLELAELRSVMRSASDLVLALGGGTITIPGAQDFLRPAFLVYLDVDAETCWVRTEGAETRPLAKGRESFLTLEEQRRPLYLACADLVVDGCASVREISKRIRESVPPGLHEAIIASPGSIGASSVGISAPPEGIYQARPSAASWRIELQATSRGSLVLGGPGSRADLGMWAEQAAAEGRQARIITDSNVWSFWGEEADRLLAPLTGGSPAWEMTPGENSKNLEVAGRCWQWLAEQGLRRRDIIVALGGGVVGDLAGFVAAGYMRGAGFWQVPTTLLSQVDSSVGGKVAVNLPAGKNLVGSFYQPDMVVIDPRFLSSLPQEELVNGLGEVVKYALLSGEDLLTVLEESSERLLQVDAQAIDSTVQQCVRYKTKVVETDEKEQGLRAVLNLGHTFAHALEAAEGYQGLAHGRAVALGLLVSLRLSEIIYGLDASLRLRVTSLLERLQLPVRHSLPQKEWLRAAAGRDKKVTSAGSGFVLLPALGEPAFGVNVSWSLFEEALEVVQE